MNIAKLVIDEGISAFQIKEFESYCQKNNIIVSDLLFIKEKYPQMPDNEIIKHILTQNTVLFTNDRVFHNKLISKEMQSFYISPNGNITNKQLKNVVLKQKGENISRKSELKEDYRFAKSEIYELILPSNPGQLKKLNVKRRRIRSYFEGQDNMEKVAATVSICNCKNDVIIGIRIRITSKSGVKALDATENYILENKNPDIGLIALCHTMFIIIKLMLQDIDTKIFYDSERIPADMQLTFKNEEYQSVIPLLKAQFSSLKISNVKKHKQLDLLRSKLAQLCNDKTTNEILESDFNEIVNWLNLII